MPESKPIPVEILVGGSYTEPVHIEKTRTRTPKVARRRKEEVKDNEKVIQQLLIMHEQADSIMKYARSRKQDAASAGLLEIKAEDLRARVMTAITAAKALGYDLERK